MDESRFESSVAPFLPLLRSAARARLGEDSAEDAVSETLLTLWRKASALPEDDLRPLALTILHGHIRNSLRSRQRRQRAWDAALAERGDGLVDTWPSLDDHLLLRSWLGQLSAQDRALLLAWSTGLRATDLARLQGCSEAAAAKRLARARARLQGIAEKNRGDGVQSGRGADI